MSSNPGSSAALTPEQIERVVGAITAAWEQDKADWWAVKAACVSRDQVEGCDCSYKDCYDHGKWHNCPHGEPSWGPRAVEAIVREVSQ